MIELGTVRAARALIVQPSDVLVSNLVRDIDL